MDNPEKAAIVHVKDIVRQFKQFIYVIPFSHHVQVFYVVGGLYHLLWQDCSAYLSVREKACYILLPVICLIKWLVLFST
nr:MAG TPA: hypothetical protein [Caudoviricetes sp.]